MFICKYWNVNFITIRVKFKKKQCHLSKISNSSWKAFRGQNPSKITSLFQAYSDIL